MRVSLSANWGANTHTGGRCFHMLSSHVENEIRLLGASKISLRLAEGKDGPVFTENGNFILDIHLSNIVPDLEQKLKAITGVIESGLFIGYDITVLMANR